MSTKPQRTDEEIQRIIAYDRETLEEITAGRTFLPQTVHIDVDETGWWSATTPVGRIGNYATLDALLMAIINAYETTRVQASATPDLLMAKRPDLLDACRKAHEALTLDGDWRMATFILARIIEDLTGDRP